MKLFISTTVLLTTSFAVNALPTADFKPYESGFQNPTVVSSVGGYAICIQGNIPVQTSSTNTIIDFEDPANRTVVTNLIQELYQVNSTFAKSVSTGNVNISGTYNINSKICFPASTGVINPNAVQILTHGIGFNKEYWNFYSADYSYVDTMAKAGFTTFLYDRLGAGNSDHPDAIQIVQAPLHVNILHELINMLRAGAIANTKFLRVIGVGHSFGSDITAFETSRFPNDLDAAILTGYSADTDGQAPFFSSLNLDIASNNLPNRFSTLSNSYLVSSTVISTQLGFFRLPNFDPLLLEAAEAAKQTITIGELFTKMQLGFPALNYTNPVMIVDGENDIAKCNGNCLLPSNENQLAAALRIRYPAAKNSSTYYVAPSTGHGLNFHYTAKAAYANISNFLSMEGF